MLAPWKKNYDKPRQYIKSREITLPAKVHIMRAMVFPVVMCGCESWSIKMAEHSRTDAFKLWYWRRLLRVPWSARRSNQLMLKEINSEFTGRTDAEAEAPILWPPDMKNQLTGKDPDAREDRKQEKGTTKDEMVGWHHRLKGHEFEQTLGVGEGWESLVCCSPCSHKELDTTEQLKNSNCLGSVTHTGSSQHIDTLFTRLSCGLLFPSDILYFLVTKVRYCQEKPKQNHRRYKLISIFPGV